MRKIADFTVKPGDLVRPRENWHVTTWRNVARVDGKVDSMLPNIQKTPNLETFATVIAVDENPAALLIYSPDMLELVWVWRNSVVLVKT